MQSGKLKNWRKMEKMEKMENFEKFSLSKKRRMKNQIVFTIASIDHYMNCKFF
jgi:hypothetical protein